MVATTVSTYFYSQDDVDNSVRSALNLCDGQTGEDFGVRVWTDEDEWSDWKHVGDLYCTLNCVGGICDSLVTCLVRVGPINSVIVCPAMNTHIYQHCLTARHLTAVQEDLEYLVSGPQEGGRLACGDDGKYLMVNDMHSLVQCPLGPGRMTN
ncbi:hypothetical protein I312_102683 [Cryptococcus bacillisporus CA1280]|uniref:uncharacterized protein n=1 Tax=Cryptococcus bacillisporus CA1280 TaxID=1296109 RepID=UPI0033680D0C